MGSRDPGCKRGADGMDEIVDQTAKAGKTAGWDGPDPSAKMAVFSDRAPFPKGMQ